MQSNIIDYLISNHISLIQYLNPTDIQPLLITNKNLNNTINNSNKDWLSIIKIMHNAKDILPNPIKKTLLIVINENHKINVSYNQKKYSEIALIIQKHLEI
tara:strand:- start:1712 stop:2014 length:303 start_codon:yes stop_codon:yes gene_type:complete